MVGGIEPLDKHQIPMAKFQISTNDQNPKPDCLGHLKIGNSDLFGIWDLVIWSLDFLTTKHMRWTDVFLEIRG
jgi:hypothetical protein